MIVPSHFHVPPNLPMFKELYFLMRFISFIFMFLLFSQCLKNCIFLYVSWALFLCSSYSLNVSRTEFSYTFHELYFYCMFLLFSQCLKNCIFLCVSWALFLYSSYSTNVWRTVFSYAFHELYFYVPPILPMFEELYFLMHFMSFIFMFLLFS